jgi:hypothetical protein
VDVREIRKKLNAELCNLFCSSDISYQIKVQHQKPLPTEYGRMAWSQLEHYSKETFFFVGDAKRTY